MLLLWHEITNLKFVVALLIILIGRGYVVITDKVD